MKNITLWKNIENTHGNEDNTKQSQIAIKSSDLVNIQTQKFDIISAQKK